jgi:hypothetical protein
LVAHRFVTGCTRHSAEPERPFGIDELQFAQSTIAAVTHVDYSMPVQTVHQQRIRLPSEEK